jgi:hypothetical protein
MNSSRPKTSGYASLKLPDASYGATPANYGISQLADSKTTASENKSAVACGGIDKWQHNAAVPISAGAEREGGLGGKGRRMRSNGEGREATTRVRKKGWELTHGPFAAESGRKQSLGRKTIGGRANERAFGAGFGRLSSAA